MSATDALKDLAHRVRDLDPDALDRHEFLLRRTEIIAGLRCLSAQIRNEGAAGGSPAEHAPVAA